MCGSTNFTTEVRPSDGNAQRCHPGCETLWHADDLVGERFDYLHEKLHPAEPVPAVADE